ncbi:MAG TPA: VOC family protein [Hanamia sp.]|nr:VOC family protein [Hanamia sp.]
MLNQSKAFSSFSVHDIQIAKDFYGGVLGLKVSDNPMGLIELDFGADHKTMIYPKPDHKPATFTVLNFPVADIEKTVDELTSKGVVFEQYDYLQTDDRGISRDPRGPKVAWFKDPAGNILSVVEM